jgi:hypothetical protein
VRAFNHDHVSSKEAKDEATFAGIIAALLLPLAPGLLAQTKTLPGEMVTVRATVEAV